MLKRNILIGLLFTMILACSLVLPVFARDSRYISNWTLTSLWEEELGSGSTWDYFYPKAQHINKNRFSWYNEFPEEIGYNVGFEIMYMEFRPEDNMKHDDITAYMRVYLEGKYPFTLKMDFSSYTYSVICTYYQGTTEKGSFTISDFRTSIPIIDVTVVVNFGLTKVWMGGDVYEKSDSEGYIHKGRVVWEQTGSIGQYDRFVHEVEVDYGVFGAGTSQWQCYCTLRTVGIRPDLVHEDCTVDIYDQVKLTANYGKSETSLEAWLYDDPYDPWRGDFDGDMDIDVFDLVIICGLFGHSW